MEYRIRAGACIEHRPAMRTPKVSAISKTCVIMRSTLITCGLRTHGNASIFPDLRPLSLTFVIAFGIHFPIARKGIEGFLIQLDESRLMHMSVVSIFSSGLDPYFGFPAVLSDTVVSRIPEYIIGPNMQNNNQHRCTFSTNL